VAGRFWIDRESGSCCAARCSTSEGSRLRSSAFVDLESTAGTALVPGRRPGS
jgi:hypothetical protein